MPNRTILVPGPDHPVTIEPKPNRIVVTVGGRTVADTTAAVTLREANYPAVAKLPREDVDVSAWSGPTTSRTVTDTAPEADHVSSYDAGGPWSRKARSADREAPTSLDRDRRASASWSCSPSCMRVDSKSSSIHYR